MAATEQPMYEHDCDACIFLGRADGAAMGWSVAEVDLYFCANSMFGPQYVMRYGDDGPEYCSGNVENDLTWPRSQEVYRRALERGLIEVMEEDSSTPWIKPGDPVDFTKPFRMLIGG